MSPGASSAMSSISSFSKKSPSRSRPRVRRTKSRRPRKSLISEPSFDISKEVSQSQRGNGSWDHALGLIRVQAQVTK